MTMKIAIEALGIHYFGGGRSATLNLLESLFALDRQTQYTLFLSQPEPTLVTSAGNVTQVIAPVQNRFALRLWAQARLPFLTRGYDLVHFIKNLTVPLIPTRTAVTMYDMATVIHPDLYPTFDVWYWRHLQPTLLRNTDKVIAISHDAAQDVAHFYEIPLGEIAVIYPSYATHFGPVTAEAVTAVRAKYALPDEYILHVGRLDRRKNLQALVRGFAEFLANPAWSTTQEGRAFAGKLVFVGEEYRKSRDEGLYTLIDELGIGERILFTGPLPDVDIAAIYGGALMAVSASRHEGFGIAPLEAFACGTPLIANRSAGAVAEVVSDAGLLIDVNDKILLAQTMANLFQQPELREELRTRGLERAAAFSWQRAAEETLALYKEIVGDDATG